MIGQLPVGYADVRADDLALVHDLHPLPALAVRELELPAGLQGLSDVEGVQLRILGASHQVVLPRRSAGPFSEALACLPDYRSPLPTRLEVTHAGLRCSFQAATEQLSPQVLAGRVAGLRRRCANQAQSLLGEFPGSPLAVTALLVQRVEERLRWFSWHSYPQSGQLVSSCTEVAAA